MAKLFYDQGRSATAGDFKLLPGDKPPSDRDKKTLLHLLFWLTYTVEGRAFLSANQTRNGTSTQAQVSQNLRAKFSRDFGIISEPLLTALVDAHLAADRYVGANANMPDATAATELDKQAYIYQQNISVVMWSLWEDAMGQDFSMNW